MPPTLTCRSVDWLDARSPTTAWSILSVAFAGLCAADWAVPEVGMGPAYLPLIALAGWRLGPRATLAVTFSATLVNVLPHLADDPGVSAPVAAMRAVLRFGAYAFVGASACVLRGAYERERTAARRDGLTGALNRTAFDEQVSAALAAGSGGAVRVLALADLDGFKALNDAEGHAAGDDALRAFTRTAAGLLAGGERLGRLGGDEFGLLLEAPSAEAALARVAQVHRVIGAGLARSGRALGVSMGAVVIPPGSAVDLSGLLRETDALMYAAKVGGPGGLRTAAKPAAAATLCRPGRGHGRRGRLKVGAELA